MTIQSNEIEYHVNGESFTGFFAIDDQASTPLPGVLIVHEWWGHNDYVRDRAKQLAADGCAAFAIDLYGTGKVASDPDEAGELMNHLMGLEGAIETRFDAATKVLTEQPQVDQHKLCAIGYCFGGAVVLAMARAAKSLKLVASFHGLLQTDTPLKANQFRGEILVFNGADDPMVSEEILQGFDDEMTQAQANYTVTNYPGVLHGFTNPAATERGKATGMPLAYDEHADKGSYATTIERIQQL